MREKILEKLKEIIDPEIGFDIVSLGQIEEITIRGKKIYVKYLPTTPLCPFIPIIIDQIAMKIKELGLEPEIEIDFENQWTPDRIDKKLREKLGL